MLDQNMVYQKIKVPHSIGNQNFKLKITKKVEVASNLTVAYNKFKKKLCDKKVTPKPKKGKKRRCFVKIKNYNILFIIFPIFRRSNIKSNKKYLFLSTASGCFRFSKLLNYFTRHGKRFKSLSFFFNFISVLKFRLKCRNVLFLLNTIFSSLEPFFALRQLKRRSQLVLTPVLNSIKSRASFACEFFFQSILDLQKKNMKVSLVSLAVREIVLLLKNRRPGSFIKLQKYNVTLQQHQLKVKNFKYGSKFPTDYKL